MFLFVYIFLTKKKNQTTETTVSRPENLHVFGRGKANFWGGGISTYYDNFKTGYPVSIPEHIDIQ